ncbi:MAG: hypothetical protein GEU99_22495 [Luteitalea sp.]|nr:hypothetical protein [Luteitalea sp.]
MISRSRRLNFSCGGDTILETSSHSTCYKCSLALRMKHVKCVQCTFVSRTGRRCRARGFLEFHHTVPFALGGEASVENLRLLCRAHNQQQAARDFGPWDATRVRESSPAYGASPEQLVPARVLIRQQNLALRHALLTAPGAAAREAAERDVMNPGEIAIVYRRDRRIRGTSQKGEIDLLACEHGTRVGERVWLHREVLRQGVNVAKTTLEWATGVDCASPTSRVRHIDNGSGRPRHPRSSRPNPGAMLGHERCPSDRRGPCELGFGA